SGYTARYNVHLENTISHVFDMHGARDFEKYKLVGLWHFDDGKGLRTNDYSIYNGDHDGTLCNMDESSWVEGRIGKALRFDGRDDYVDMGKQRQLSPRAGLTVAAWVRPDSIEGTRTVFSKADTGETGSGYSLRVTDGVLEGALYAPEGKRCTLRAGEICAGEWQHVAMTWNGKVALLYVDGERVGELACKGRKLSANRLAVGRDSATATSFFRGVIDGGRLYSRAQSAGDIQRLFQGNGDIAGRLILMHHNTFRPASHAALTVRGRPSVGCWAHHNRFYAPRGGHAVRQVNATGNFHVFDNQYLGRGLEPAPDFTQAPLFGRWTFDEEAGAVVQDTSGRKRHGTVMGPVETGSWETLERGRALLIAREKRWLEIPQASDKDFPRRVTVGLRMRVDDLRPHQVLLDNGLFRLFHRGEWAGARLYFLYRIEENERAGQSSWGHYVGVKTMREIEEGEWFEVVGERDGDVMRIYLNGMLESEAKCVGKHTVATRSRGMLRVGHSVDGAIDDLWIRSAARPGMEKETKRTTPNLFVTGERGYEEDGVAPDTGTASTPFRFRVLHRDPTGRAPAIGFPRVHILRDGQRYLNEAPVTMLAVDDSRVEDGRTYAYTMRLPKGDRYRHFFEVETTDGEVYETTRFDGPRVTEGSSAPVLSWTSQGGFSRDGVQPEIGDVATNFDFRVLFSDLDGDLPHPGHPRVHILKGGKEIDGSPFAMEPMKDNPTWQGRPYRFRTELAAGGDYSYYFTAKDADGNEAPKTLTRRSPTVDPGKDVAAPDLSNIRVAKLGAHSATVEWQTDEPATSQVEIGLDTKYGRLVASQGLANVHALRIDQLEPGTTYHYRVSSTDAVGNQAQSGDYVYRTLVE
ncbi:fibronectin type III domain-containing protein, partial [PVC group bacterium]|nr:fibronectin type III domain-containing protein [PVC group bacterium]